MSVELFRVGIGQVVKTAQTTGLTHEQIRQELARNLAWLILAGYPSNVGAQKAVVAECLRVMAKEMETRNGAAKT